MSNLLNSSCYADQINSIIIFVLIVSIAICFGLAHLSGKIASEKGYSYAWFFCLTLLLGGLIGLIIVAVIPQQSSEKQMPRRQVWICKRCGRANQANASYCHNCGEKRVDATQLWICKNCGKTNEGTAKFCHNCGKQRQN